MKATDKIHLVYINDLPFLMVNPSRNLLVRMCNSQVTKTWNISKEDADRNVFELFNCSLHIVPTPFDRRTSQFKNFEKKVKYFHVGMLPLIKELTNNQ